METGQCRVVKVCMCGWMVEVDVEVKCVRVYGGSRCGGEVCEGGWWR